MKIAVVAANGRVGKLIAEEAVKRGNDVTAIVRSQNKTDAQHEVIKDIFDIQPEDLKGYDVVIDAFGAWEPEKLDQHTASLMHLADAMSGSPERLLVVGGAGSLFVDPEHKTMLIETPDFPDQFKPLAQAQVDELAELRKRDDVNWTFLSPAADFQADGKRTGSYILAGEELTPNAQGDSVISYADYAIAMVDEAERTGSDAHVKERISVVSK
ncbi:MAG: NAD(P)H-binding protein [Eggerthellaceae bacterium]|nr:NAD(P)H-binding protein [Eggerthellaceae bacterium]